MLVLVRFGTTASLAWRCLLNPGRNGAVFIPRSRNDPLLFNSNICFFGPHFFLRRFRPLLIVVVQVGGSSYVESYSSRLSLHWVALALALVDLVVVDLVIVGVS